MSIKFFYNFCLKEDDRAALDSDILSGVRRSYFSGFERIKDRITINSDGDSLTYEYQIEKDKPARWLVKASDGTVLEDAVASDGGKYFIYYYQDQSVYKRLLFSRLHTLLRVEYFDLSTGIPYISLEPRKAQTGLCILYTSRMVTQSLVIYPEPYIAEDPVRERMGGFEDYTVLASTNEGVIRFLSEEQLSAFRMRLEEVEKELALQKEKTFVSDGTPLFDRLKAKDFNVKRNLATALDITEAEEFSFVIPKEDFADSIPEASAAEAVETVMTADDAEQQTEMPVADEQNAADEAEDVVSAIAVDEIRDEVSADTSEKKSSEAEPEEFETEPEEIEADTEELEAEISETAAVESDDAEHASADEAETADADAPDVSEPDKLIMADGAVYRYYGELDDQGDRSGYGRTLTDEGRTAYEGHYLRDKRSGKGSYYYKDGSLCYAGDWTENVRHGVGVGVSSQDGSIHVGRWALNKPVGSGVRLASDGEIKFVCKELSDGTTVLMNYMPDDTVIVAKYDEKGKKLGEKTVSLKDISF